MSDLPKVNSMERMTAVLKTPDGEFVQVSDWAETFSVMEEKINAQYCLGEKMSWLVGSTIERIVKDAYAKNLPDHEHVGD